MFTPQYRTQLRSELLEHAANDKRIAGAALTGSASVDREDRWSDIDLAFGVIDPGHVAAVLADFTALMYERYAALHHHDVRAGDWIYRVFFLPGVLQVDLAFVAQEEFRPLGPAFRLIFGEANSLQPSPSPAATDIIGLAWLHALHARSCILRGKLWQAEYMVSAIRDHVMVLACIRHGLPTAHARGMDLLPESVTAQLLEALVRKLDSDELWRTLGVAVHALLIEVNLSNADFGARIAAGLTELSGKPIESSTHVEFLKHIYNRFNARDMEAVLAVLHEDVAWANGMEGGHVHGRGGVRAYWTRQWAMLDPHVEPTGFSTTPAGAIVVEVHQVVHDRAGNLLADQRVGHIFQLQNGLVKCFDIRGT